MHYAHTTSDDRPWEPLEDHLREVAELAGEFADAFGAKDWGHLAGLWHDLGKYSRKFQDYLRIVVDDHPCFKQIRLPSVLGSLIQIESAFRARRVRVTDRS